MAREPSASSLCASTRRCGTKEWTPIHFVFRCSWSRGPQHPQEAQTPEHWVRVHDVFRSITDVAWLHSSELPSYKRQSGHTALRPSLGWRHFDRRDIELL